MIGNWLTVQLEGSGKACLTTYMLEEQAEHGDLTPDDVDNIKGAATLLFIGACMHLILIHIWLSLYQRGRIL